MLKKLHVKNFAIIDDISLDLEPGFTVLTGQTGAGKSLIIDSIGLLIGDRADSGQIRYGETKATILGIFDSTKEINDYLFNLGIEISNTIAIQREITKTKSTAKINGSVVNIQMLKGLGSLLADIHTQNDTIRLINKDNYLNLIDPENDKKFNDLLAKYVIDYNNYHASLDEYRQILKSSDTEKDQLEYYEFIYKEISSLDLHKNEDIELEEKISKLKNFDKIFESLKKAINYLDNEYFNLDNVYKALEDINSIKEFDKNYNETASKLSEGYYNLDDALHDLKDYIKGLDYDQDELNNAQERLQIIDNLKLKYHHDLDGIIKYAADLKLKIDLVTNYDGLLKDKYEALSLKFKDLIRSGKVLSEYRQKRALIISQNIEQMLKELEINHAKFEISFVNKDFNDPLQSEVFMPSGIDEVDFLISTNLGEPLQSLVKVASGGEMSRIMLAFKAYFAHESKLSLMVFDEIDTGVSGSVAFEIAKKIKQIANECQVIAITHLPQVASSADNQLYIYKEEVDGRTLTRVNKMNKSDRILQIAKMIFGEKVSSFALEQAKDLLK